MVDSGVRNPGKVEYDKQNGRQYQKIKTRSKNWQSGLKFAPKKESF
jgi:hypothetical protein